MASIFIRFPNGRAKALTLSYDDGVEQDSRLMQIMDKNGLKGTFNLNSGSYAAEGNKYPEGQIHRRMTEKQTTALYKNSGHEVAVHTFTHPFLERLPVHLVMEELLEDRKKLEEQFGTIVRGMAYPFGTYSDEVVDCLRKAGLVYGRTVASSHNFNLPMDWLRLEPTCHHKDEKLAELAKQFAEETPSRTPWMFYLWGHSYEFEQDDNWQVIEDFAAYMGGREDIWYAANIEIYDYVRAFYRLEFSADAKRVYNPTVTDLFFVKDGKEYCVKSGCMTEME